MNKLVSSSILLPFLVEPLITTIVLATATRKHESPVSETTPGDHSSKGVLGVHHLSWLEDIASTNSADVDVGNNDQERQRRLEVEINECLDATEWFSTRSTGGVNILRTYYNCECTGDLSSYFQIACSLQDYCSTDDVNSLHNDDGSSTEICLNHNVTYDFSVNTIDGTSTIGQIQRGTTCVEYLQNGPLSGPLCFVNRNVCATLMKDEHSYSTESSVAICNSRLFCEYTLPTLGYTDEDVKGLCPTMTLNGMDCNPGGFQQCGDVTSEVYYSSTPDCSNVEPCAKEYCMTKNRVEPTPRRTFLVFPECLDRLRSEDPSATPSYAPSYNPSNGHSVIPSIVPTLKPSALPIALPSYSPSDGAISSSNRVNIMSTSYMIFCLFSLSPLFYTFF